MEDRLVHLHWASDNSEDGRPCFGPADLDLDLDNKQKLRATPETLAALFGIADPTRVQVHPTADGAPTRKSPASIPLSLNENGAWPVEAGRHYLVSTASDENDRDLLPFAQIFAHLPGATHDEKSDVLQSLSNTFYQAIWHDPNVPADFADKFVNATSTAGIQAFRQFDWLYEVWGGPAAAQEPSREALIHGKVVAKHTASRMTLEHSLTWLRLMEQATQKVLADHGEELRRSMGRYWLYFYAWFPYTEEERRELRRMVLSGDNGQNESSAEAAHTIPVSIQEIDSSLAVIPFAVRLPISIFQGPDEPAVHPSMSALLQDTGVVGSITVLKKSFMVWFGWGQLEAEYAAAADQRTAVQPPPMGPLIVAMPRTHYAGAFSSEASSTKLVGGDYEDEEIACRQMAIRLSSKLGVSVFCSSSLGHTPGPLSQGMDPSLVQHRAAALAEKKVYAILKNQSAAVL